MTNPEKRSVSTDALETLGMIHTREEKRDAIHLAVMPAEAGETLDPGEHINVTDGIALGTDVGHGQGIVDPFLTKKVKKGQKFWFVVYPRTIQSLRHVWSHPAFPDEPVSQAVNQEHAVKTVLGNTTKLDWQELSRDKTKEKEASVLWIHNHADDLGLNYDALMMAAKDWIHSGDYFVQQGGQSMQSIFDAYGFWKHYEVVTGHSVNFDKRESFFSCSC